MKAGNKPHRLRMVLLAAGAGVFVILGAAAVHRWVRVAFPSFIRPASHSWRPAPEYAPAGGVMVSELIFAPKYQGLPFARALLATGVRLLVLRSEPYTKEQNDDFLRSSGFTQNEFPHIEVVNIAHETPWVRDFGPISLIDTNKHSPQKPVLRLAGFSDRLTTGLSETVPYQLGIYLGASVEHVPLALAGGNLLTDGERCLVAGDFLDTLAMKSADTYASVRDNARALMEEGLGCRELIVLENAPHEHIDMWFKVTGPGRGVISAVRPETLDLLREGGYGAALTEMIAIRTKLQKLARALGPYYTLSEVPLPVVHRGVFRNYTNAVLVNGHALIPQFRKSRMPGFEYPDEKLQAFYEGEVRTVYEKQGFQVTLVDADALIADGGALHCATGHLSSSNGAL